MGRRRFHYAQDSIEPRILLSSRFHWVLGARRLAKPTPAWQKPDESYRMGYASDSFSRESIKGKMATRSSQEGEIVKTALIGLTDETVRAWNKIRAKQGKPPISASQVRQAVALMSMERSGRTRRACD